MLFTREPIIETVITARNGYRLCVRSSKSPVEELLVDALEIVNFGQALFFRCVERPKAFLLPVNDYEVSEVRETRLVLKHMAQENAKKPEVAHVRSSSKHHDSRPDTRHEIRHEQHRAEEVKNPESSLDNSETKESAATRNDRRRERRRQRRRRSDSRGDSQSALEGENQEDIETDASLELDTAVSAAPETLTTEESPKAETPAPRSKGRTRTQAQVVSALIPPPSTLVSDLFRYDSLTVTKSENEVKEEKDPIQNIRHEFVDALQIRGEADPFL